MSVFSVLPSVPDSVEGVVAAVDGLFVDIGFPSVFVRGEELVFSPREGFVEVNVGEVDGFCLPVDFFSEDVDRFFVEFLIWVRQLHFSASFVGGRDGVRLWNLLVDSQRRFVDAFEDPRGLLSSTGFDPVDRLAAQWLYSLERFLHKQLRDCAPVALTPDGFFLSRVFEVGAFASLKGPDLTGWDDDRFGFPSRRVVAFWDECYREGVDWRILFDDFVVEQVSFFSDEMSRFRSYSDESLGDVGALVGDYAEALTVSAREVLTGFDTVAAGRDLTPSVLVVDGAVLNQARYWRTPLFTAGQLGVLYGAVSFLSRDEGYWVFAGPRFVIDMVEVVASHLVLPFHGPVVGDVTVGRLEVLRSLLDLDGAGVYGTFESAWDAACDLA